MKIYLLLLSIICTGMCNSQVLSINISENNFGVDESKSLIVSRIDDINNYANTSGYVEVVITLGLDDYTFNSIPNSLEYSNSYLITNTDTSNQYTLYFTPLPIVSINSNTTIPDEPKVLASFTYADEEQIVVSNIGIELRGGFSQSYPKKTYDLEFWDDETGNETNNEQFKELRSDDDWILDALYNEPLRIRSHIAHKLWLDMHTPYYIDDESKAKSGADVNYVEMFLNGKYNGLYNLSEQIDRKQLKLKSYKDEIRGELYKGISWGASTFTSVPNYDNDNREWSGYEYKYPKEDEITNWSNLYNLTNFVINSSDIDFTNSIWTRFDEGNYIDYFLFLNLLRATDNTGKNIYVAKYKADEPYFYVPWDLDGCFGTIWNGTNKNITDDILKNGFINRVININPNNVSATIANKWFSYRNNIFSNESLSNLFSEKYNFLNTNKIYEREALVYTNYTFDNENLSYLLTWLENRLEYLDTYFGNLLSNEEESSISKTHTIYPNPATDLIYIKSTNGTVGKSYKIYNNIGQLVIENVTHNNSISVQNLKKGIYFINIENSTYKLLKK